MAATDMEKATSKMIDLTFKSQKLTSEVLKAAMRDFLSGSAQKSGKMSFKELSKENGKLENIEVTENNIKDFLNVAKKYDVDFAVKRDGKSEPQTYHVFFATNKAENFKRAFTEYVAVKSNEIKPKRGEMSREQLNKQAEKIAKQPKKQKERVKERSEVR